MMDQEGFRAYLHVPDFHDFLDPTRRSQTSISFLMSLLRERCLAHDRPRGHSGLLACCLILWTFWTRHVVLKRPFLY